jgi:hypothetical protein
MMPRRLFLACGISGILLGGVAGEWRMFHPEFAGAEDYHRRVRRAIEAVPVATGNWMSEDTAVLPAAQAMLRPNVILSRHYINLLNGRQASFLLVQCLDARDLLGHYPPNCYKANGYEEISAVPRRCVSGALQIDGTLYTFSSAKLGRKDALKVFDFMILPNGRIAPDMDSVSAIARDRRIRHFGAAQLQVVTEDDLSERDRQAIVDDLLVGVQGAIDVIRTGVTP